MIPYKGLQLCQPGQNSGKPTIKKTLIVIDKVIGMRTKLLLLFFFLVPHIYGADISVSEPVAGIQFDAISTGSCQLLATGKILATHQTGNSKRFLVYSLNQNLFEGKFLSCTGSFYLIGGVVACDADAHKVNAVINYLSPPTGLRIKEIL